MGAWRAWLFLLLCMKVVLYNPLASSDPTRLAEISVEFRTADAIILVGTQRRMRELEVEKDRTDYHWVVHWGWRRTQHSNRSCGVSVMVHRRFAPRALHQVWTPPPALRGRCGAIRLRQGSVDVLLGAFYMPPRGLPGAIETGRMVMEWAGKVAGSVGTRTMPIYGLDLNDGLGIRENGIGRPIEVADDVVGIVEA